MKPNRLPTDRRSYYTSPQGRDLSTFVRGGTMLVAILIATACGGCSMSREGPFASMQDDSELTGSIPPRAKGEAHAPTETDLAFTRAAAADVLTRGSADVSQPWENPATGARGAVTPIAQAYTAEGKTCRDFLASYVNGASESWLQGAACRSGRGSWDIHTLKPWRRS